MFFFYHNNLQSHKFTKHRQPQLLSHSPRITFFTTRWTRVAQSIHFWSDTKYAPLLAIPPTFMEMDTSSKNAGTFRDLRTAPKVVCDVNSEYRRIQVESVEIRSKILLL